jgi:hypothetical protein
MALAKISQYYLTTTAFLSVPSAITTPLAKLFTGVFTTLMLVVLSPVAEIKVVVLLP